MPDEQDAAGSGPADDDALAYAREVYAACLTVGFVDEHVVTLKRRLDADARGPGWRASLVALASSVQAASVEWAGKRAAG